MITHARPPVTVGLMLSGGLDSAVLLATLLEAGERVQPFCVATGCAWEVAERRAVDRWIAALNHPAVAPVVDLAMPVADLYGRHWSLLGGEVPDDTTADEAVALPGRNPLLLLKPLLWCGQHRIARLALATLAGNPFADATPKFVQQFGRALATATGTKVQVIRPFADKSKQEILAQAADLPLHLTFSCLSPHDGQHCGGCNKCAERAQALQFLPGGDPTVYASFSGGAAISRQGGFSDGPVY